MVYTRVLGFESGVTSVNKNMKNFFNVVIKPNEQGVLNEIKDELRQLYINDDTDRGIKGLYLTKTFYYCQLAMKYVFCDVKRYDWKEFVEHIDEFNNEPDVIRMNNSESTFNEYLQTYLKKQPKVLVDAINEIPDSFKKYKYTDEQINYIRYKLKVWLQEKGKLEKNDIYDIFYLYSFSD